jgi:hypothetical protein
METVGPRSSTTTPLRAAAWRVASVSFSNTPRYSFWRCHHNTRYRARGFPVAVAPFRDPLGFRTLRFAGTPFREAVSEAGA